MKYKKSYATKTVQSAATRVAGRMSIGLIPGRSYWAPDIREKQVRCIAVLNRR